MKIELLYKSYTMICRMYRTPEGMRGWPTVEMLRERLHDLCGKASNA